MKKLMAAVLAGLMLAGLLSGCASTANDEKVEYRWKMALNSTEGDNAYDTGVLFAQKKMCIRDSLYHLPAAGLRPSEISGNPALAGSSARCLLPCNRQQFGR